MPRAHPSELSTRAAYALIDQVARVAPAHFIITGGDPLCRDDLLQLIEYADLLGVPVSLSPSATPRLLAQDFLHLKALGINRMSLSLDGHDEHSHNSFRGVSKAWQWTMEAAKRCREAGISLQINTTITQSNIGSFEKFLPVISHLQPAVWSLFALVPVGRGATLEMPSAEQMEELYNRLYDHSLSAEYAVKTTEAMQYRRIVLQRRKSNPTPHDVSQHAAPVGINDGKGVVFISHIGEIFPSGFLPVAVGNIQSHNLLETYRKHPLLRKLRDSRQLGGKCGQCEYNTICGGSRARAYALNGDLMGEDPICSYQPPNLNDSESNQINRSVKYVECN